VLLSDLKLINRKQLRLSLKTEHPDIAKRHMRLLVPMLVAQGRLSPGGGPAEAYNPKKTGRSRLNQVDREVRRVKALSEAKYRSEALATAKRLGCPVGIIYCLAERKPELSAVTHRNRRSRARKRGRPMPMGNTWEHRSQGGKCFGWNGNVLTARLQIDGRSCHWPLKGIDDEEKAEALMGPVRVGREQLRRAALEALNCELGTNAAVVAVAARVVARDQLATAISAAGGPKKLAELVLKGPQEDVGTDVPRSAAILRAERRRMKLAALENCVQAYMKVIEASPDGPLEPREILAQKMMNEFHVTWHEARDCRREALKRAKNSNSKWHRGGRPRR
jgi:hypothetical protein